MTSGFRFAVVGPGAIADVFAESLATHGVGRVSRVLGRHPGRARAFAQRHGGELATDLGHLLQDGPEKPDAVYVATPHPAHADAVRAALRAGVGLREIS